MVGQRRWPPLFAPVRNASFETPATNVVSRAHDLTSNAPGRQAILAEPSCMPENPLICSGSTTERLETKNTLPFDQGEV